MCSISPTRTKHVNVVSALFYVASSQETFPSKASREVTVSQGGKLSLCTSETSGAVGSTASALKLRKVTGCDRFQANSLMPFLSYKNFKASRDHRPSSSRSAKQPLLSPAVTLLIRHNENDENVSMVKQNSHSALRCLLHCGCPPDFHGHLLHKGWKP